VGEPQTSGMTNAITSKVRLGKHGPEVSPLALGCMGLSGMYGATNDAAGVATIHAAIERGITLFDTGDFYGMGHNELLIQRALQGKQKQVQLSVKFGALRGPDGSFNGFDGRPAAVKTFAAYSLKRLGVEVIDIYRPARLDPQVPIEDTIGAIADLIRQGYVRHIGLSEVGVETIARAHKVHPIADLQIEYSIATRGPEREIFPLLDELGISATLYGILSRGLLSGSKPTSAADYRAHLPRFSAENRVQNERAVSALQAFAAERGMSAAQLATAWVLAKRPGYIPLIGARTAEQVEDGVGALAHPLSAAELAQLEALVPATALAGTRYPAEHMTALDSER
jgi:aryl-alcohol dehydrogenase-like predicted oxidoreductase